MTDLRVRLDEIDREFDLITSFMREGGVGSGNFGHSGRPGLVGGSLSDHVRGVKVFSSVSDMAIRQGPNGPLLVNFWVGRNGELVHQSQSEHAEYLVWLKKTYPEDAKILFGEYYSTSSYQQLDNVITNGAIRGSYSSKTGELYLSVNKITKDLLYKVKQWVKDGVMPSAWTISIGEQYRQYTDEEKAKAFKRNPHTASVSGSPWFSLQMNEFERLKVDAILDRMNY